MFAKGRTLLRASIEEEAQRYDNIIDNLKSYFESNIEKIENETKQLRNSNQDEEVISIISLNDTTIDILREGLEKCCEMLIVRIHSYAESNLHEMLKQYFGWSEYKINEEKKAICQNQKSRFSDLETYFVILIQNKNLSLELRQEWHDFDQFHKLRNQIVHSKAIESSYHIQLTTDYLKKSLSMAGNLLQTIDDLYTINNVQHL